MMMVEPRSRAAKRNLREGIQKMEKKMTPAAQVRRDFLLGRPPRPLGEHDEPEPLHPSVLWRRANESLSDIRTRMTKAGLKPEHVAAAIIYVERSTPEQPHFLYLEEKGKTPEEMRKEAFDFLVNRAEDVIVLGMILVQFDEQTKQRAIFPRLFFGLNKRGMDVLKQAANLEFTLGALLKNVN